MFTILIVCFIVSCGPSGGSLFGEDTVSKEDRAAWQMSQRSTDPSICAGITTSKNFHDGCYENVAINTKDVSLCDNVHGNPDYCKSDYAKETGDFSVCGGLDSDVTRSNCYYGVATATGNADLCPKIERVKTRDNCYRELSIYSDDANMCDAIEENSVARDDCFHAMATKKMDTNLCYEMEGASDDKMKDCIYSASIASADFDYCETLDEEARDKCVDEVYERCRSLRNQGSTEIPYYCGVGVLSPAGVPMSYD